MKKQLKQLKKQAGITLMEVIAGLLIIGLVVAGALSLSVVLIRPKRAIRCCPISPPSVPQSRVCTLARVVAAPPTSTAC